MRKFSVCLEYVIISLLGIIEPWFYSFILILRNMLLSVFTVELKVCWKLLQNGDCVVEENIGKTVEELP